MYTKTLPHLSVLKLTTIRQPMCPTLRLNYMLVVHGETKPTSRFFSQTLKPHIYYKLCIVLMAGIDPITFEN